jgi:acetolactate synthase I/II/III large subunit
VAVEKPRHGGHLIAQALKNEGVRYLFTLSGGHIAPIYDGCVDLGIEVIDFRHEQAAVHCADGWARVTLEPGVAAVTAGPGFTDGVTGIANAFYANSPILVFSGKNPIFEFEMGSLQEMDQVTIARSITKWAKTCYDTRRLADYTTAALRHATSGRPGPVFMDIPLDVQFNSWPPGVEVPEEYRTKARPAGDPDYVARAAALLDEAEHPVIFAGAGIRWSGAHDQLRELAEAVKAPVFLNSLGRGCLPPDNPYFFAAARKQALGKCDVLLALGVDWDFRLGFGTKSFSPGVRVIQVDVDGTHIGRNRPVEVGIVGDPGRVIEQLLEAGVGRAKEPQWTEEIRDQENAIRAGAEEGMNSDATPIHPQRFAREIRDFLDRDAIVVGDGGDIVGISASIINAYEPGHWLDPGPFGCLGVGPSFAIAAKLAKPDKQVCIVYGDGSFGLNAMEYDTAIRHKLPFVGIIGNDQAWGQIKVAQEAMYGEGNAPASVLGDTPYEKMVEGLGGYGERVEKPSEIRPALERAFASGMPACINVMIDAKLMQRSSYLG